MDLRGFGSVALLAIIGIAALFLFPLAHGSYSATHGPTTDLESSQFRLVLLFVLFFAGVQMAGLRAQFRAFSRGARAFDQAAPSAPPTSVLVLRR